MSRNERFLRIAIEASLAAGRAIMEIYNSEDMGIEKKDDNSPLTLADKAANDIINDFLIPTEVPIISEESNQIPYQVRKSWSECWIVDPLDGTKEFIKKNGEFTVNIALIDKNMPGLGVIYAPALRTIYFGIVKDKLAYRFTDVSFKHKVDDILKYSEEIHPELAKTQVNIVGSRSHMNQETLDFIEKEKKKGKKVGVVSKGSSLKFCLVAEGSAQIYPRFAPTMEWDTAAGQAICEAVGLKCTVRETGEPLTYNRQNLLNQHFCVSNEG